VFSASSDRDHYDSLTPLESFLCTTLGLGALSLALIAVFAIVPSFEPPRAYPRMSLLCIMTGLLSIMSFVSYNSIGGLGKFLGTAQLLLALWGWWVIIFSAGWQPKVHQSRVPKRLKKL